MIMKIELIDVHHLVATSLLAMWLLGCEIMGIEGRGYVGAPGLMVVLVGACCLLSFDWW